MITITKDSEHSCRAWLEDDRLGKRLATEAECLAYFLLTKDHSVIDYFKIVETDDRWIVVFSDGSTREASPLDRLLNQLVQSPDPEVKLKRRAKDEQTRHG